MNNFFTKVLGLLILLPVLGQAQEVNGHLPWSCRMIESEIIRFPESWQIDFRTVPKWDYTNGLECHAILQAANYYDNETYFRYAQLYADHMLSVTGDRIKTYKIEEYNLDKIAPGPMLFDLYRATDSVKYLNAMRLLRSQLDTHPRTVEGGLWHKKTYPNQMWLDGLYMAQPFYAEYTNKFGPEEAYQDIIKQFMLVAKGTFDPKTGLYRHAFDASKSMFWADSITGQSAHAWGRAMGWYMMALVDVLEFIPDSTPNRSELLTLLNQVAKGLSCYQDKKTGLFYQVLDAPKRAGNYLESTASCMFAYATLKAVRLGYLPRKYKKMGCKTYDGILRNFIEVDQSGVVSLTRCCAVAGLGGKTMRDGSFDYYITEPIRNNDPKGIGPFIKASLEIEMLSK